MYGTTVTIRGQFRDGVNSVRFGNVPGVIVGTPSSSRFDVIVQNGASGPITVVDGNGAAHSSYPNLFTYLPPTLDAFSPAVGAIGKPITINGSNLIATTSVTFGGVPAASFSINNQNGTGSSITAVLGSGATGDIIVTTPGGKDTLTGFTYINAPVINSFSPTSAPKGTTVVISGTNFTGASAVTFGPLTPAASFSVVNSTTINAVVGSGATGNIMVTTPGGKDTSAATFTYLPPVLTGISPASAPYGVTVTLTGNYFTGTTAVKFGGVNAKSFTVVNPTTITAVIDTGATGAVNILNPAGNITSSSFTYLPPTITSITPASAPIGTTITINGNYLSGATSVSFGGVNAASFTVVNANTITAVIAAGASGSAKVVCPGGTATSTSSFTYLGPTISSFSPVTGPKGTIVNISGNYLSGATSVKFGGLAAASFTVNSANSITAVVGAGNSGAVTVTNPGGTATSADNFTYIPPSITSFSPSSGIAGTAVTIRGNLFLGATSVKFGNVAASSFTVVDSTTITAIVSAGATGTITIIAPGGTATSSTNFSYLPPTITSFTPSSAGTSSTVTITGTNFTGATAVKFGTIAAASFVVVNNTTINAVVGPGATGRVSVTTPGGTANSTGTFTYIPPPTITSFTPTTGVVGNVVTITGTNFTGTTSVKFGVVAASSFTVVNATTINAFVGSGGTGNITVTTPGGTATSATQFVYAAPTITSYTPTSATYNGTVTITGTNFTRTISVSFGGTPALSFTVVNNTTLTAVVSNGTTGTLQVTTYGGVATAATQFTYLSPIISGFYPTSAPYGSTVTIYGNYFTGATGVKFGNTPATSFTVVNATTITAVVGEGSTGPITVTNPGGSPVSATNFTYLPPVITSFSPTAGGEGTVVNITGNYFTNATAVSFLASTIPVQSFTVNSPSSITAVIGRSTESTGFITSAISVTTPGGVATSNSTFTYYTPPRLLSFSPTFGFTGTIVKLRVANVFTAPTSVNFGGVPASSFSINSTFDTITAIVGQGASEDITFTTFGGTTGNGAFTYYPAPTITSFTPTSAANRAVVTIKGTSFVSVIGVKFGTVSAYSFYVINDSTIVAIVGPGSTGSVSVTTPGGTGTKTGFVYIPSAPTVSSGFSPSLVCSTGTIINIRGLNFTNTYSVAIGGVSTAFTFVSDTLITVSATTQINSGQVTVTNTTGSSSSSRSIMVGDMISGGLNTSSTNPNPFQLCGGNPRKLEMNLPGVYTYQCNNQSGNNILISSPGSYLVTATDQYGCQFQTDFLATASTTCDGYLEIESDTVVSYFKDTINVRVKIKNGVNIFSVFSYLNFNTSQVRLISSQMGNYLGSNVLSQPPVITGGRIDFGMSKFNGDVPGNGDGLIYEFKFVLVNILPSTPPFSAVRNNFFTTTFNLSNISVTNSSGLQPASFATLSKTIANTACRYYVPVWPGDLNSDKKVNVSDILPIGYFYGLGGPIRPNGSLQWVVQPAPLWGYDKTNKNSSAYRTFADGNADGVINLADQTSIGFNLNRVHARPQAGSYVAPEIKIDQTAGVPTLNIIMPDTVIQPTSLPMNEVANITIGSPSSPLSNLYGIAFDIYFNPNAVNTSAITTDYTNSIFGAQGTNFTKIEDRSDLVNGRLSIGITRFNTTAINATGGSVLTVTLPLISNAPGGWFKVSAIPADCNDPNGNALTINGSVDSLRINSTAPCSVNNWTGSVNSAWENPGNWSCGSVPGENTVVYVTGNLINFPEINSMATCKTVYTTPGVRIKVNPGFKLDVTGRQ